MHRPILLPFDAHQYVNGWIAWRRQGSGKVIRWRRMLGVLSLVRSNVGRIKRRPLLCIHALAALAHPCASWAWIRQGLAVMSGNTAMPRGSTAARLEPTYDAKQKFANLFRLPHLDQLLGGRSEEHTSELQSLMRLSYAVFCLKKKNNNNS